METELSFSSPSVQRINESLDQVVSRCQDDLEFKVACVLPIYRLTELACSLFNVHFEASNPSGYEANKNDIQAARSRIDSFSGGSSLNTLAHQCDILRDILRPIEIEFQSEAKTTEFPVWRNIVRDAIDVDSWVIRKMVTNFFQRCWTPAEALHRLDAEEVGLILEVFYNVVYGNDNNDRSFAIHQMENLIIDTGRLPISFILKGISRLSAYAEFGGGFADIYQGKLSDGTVVALKVLRFFINTEREKAELHKELVRECLTWKPLHHHNILPFLGVCYDLFDWRPAMVTPWMKQGNALSYMSKNPSADKFHLIAGIANGLHYLHSLRPTVVHGDLRCANVLVDDDGNPKIADFGLARLITWNSINNISSRGGRGSLRWQAPELIISSRDESVPKGATVQTDVFAFGRVCLEVLTEKMPFFECRLDGDVIAAVALHLELPTRPDGVDGMIWNLLVACWSVQPFDRPTMESVVQSLEDIGISAPLPPNAPVYETNTLIMPPFLLDEELPLNFQKDEGKYPVNARIISAEAKKRSPPSLLADEAVRSMKLFVEEEEKLERRQFESALIRVEGTQIRDAGAFEAPKSYSFLSPGWDAVGIVLPSRKRSWSSVRRPTLHASRHSLAERYGCRSQANFPAAQTDYLGCVLWDTPSRRARAQALTQPPQERLRIIMQARSNQWYVVVDASNAEKGVTMGDLQSQIHTFLTTCTSRSDFEAQSKERRDEIENTFWKNRAWNYRSWFGPGIRWYDWLGEFTVFGGLQLEDRSDVLERLGSNGGDGPVLRLLCVKEGQIAPEAASLPIILEQARTTRGVKRKLKEVA